MRAAVTTFMLLHFGLVRVPAEPGFGAWAHSGVQGVCIRHGAGGLRRGVRCIADVVCDVAVPGWHGRAAAGSVLLGSELLQPARPQFHACRGVTVQWLPYQRAWGMHEGFWYWEVLIVSMRKILLLAVVVTVDGRYSQLSLLLLILTGKRSPHYSAA